MEDPSALKVDVTVQGAYSLALISAAASHPHDKNGFGGDFLLGRWSQFEGFVALSIVPTIEKTS